MQFSCTEKKYNKTLTCLLINPKGANTFWVNFIQTKKKKICVSIYHVYIYSANVFCCFFFLRITPEEFLETKIRSVFLQLLTKFLQKGNLFICSQMQYCCSGAEVIWGFGHCNGQSWYANRNCCSAPWAIIWLS